MTMEYYGTGNASLEFPFNFVLLSNGNESSRPADIKEYIAEWMDVMPAGGVANWVVSDYSLCSCSSECSDKCLCLSQARNYTVLVLHRFEANIYSNRTYINSFQRHESD